MRKTIAADPQGSQPVPNPKPLTLAEAGIHYLAGDINKTTTSKAIEFILDANINQSRKYDEITLIINSPGGYCMDGYALIDVMFGSKVPIRTVGIGMIASMGFLTFLAGKKGTRTLTPNCMIMSHQYAGIEYGKEHELVASRKGHDIASEMMMRHYRRTTGLKDAEIRKHLLPAHDVWLTADEAKKLGVCDIVKDLKPLV